jgi:hypothetical protein
MVDVFGHNREQNVAKTALALMAEVGVVATPDNFELFYAYTSGENPALSQVMAAFIKVQESPSPPKSSPISACAAFPARAPPWRWSRWVAISKI